MEHIYKAAQVGIFRYAAHDKIEKIPNKKRLIAELRILLYDMTKEHLSAQKQLRKMLGMPEQETENETPKEAGEL